MVLRRKNAGRAREFTLRHISDILDSNHSPWVHRTTTDVTDAHALEDPTASEEHDLFDGVVPRLWMVPYQASGAIGSWVGFPFGLAQRREGEVTLICNLLFVVRFVNNKNNFA